MLTQRLPRGLVTAVVVRTTRGWWCSANDGFNRPTDDLALADALLLLLLVLPLSLSDALCRVLSQRRDDGAKKKRYKIARSVDYSKL